MNYRRYAALMTTAMLAAAPFAHSAEPTLGAELYAAYCAGCHGPYGEGDGPLAATVAPNLRTLQQRSGNVFPTDAVTAYIDGRTLPAAHGERLMPIWGEVFQAETPGAERTVRDRIAALVDFIAELQYR
jgi:mono/diheme cytochrome c family protein